MTDEQIAELEKTDAAALIRLPEFRRFLWRAIQLGRIFEAVTDGSEGRHLAYHEGRRNLVLELLALVEQGQPVSHPDGIPLLTAIQVLREEARQPTSENQNVRRSRNDRDPAPDDADG